MPLSGHQDLRKVWYTHSACCKEGTLVVENTAQMCRYNYGNAIYVPTYRGRVDDRVFCALQNYFELALEDACVDVTKVKKCKHLPGPHACYHQSWWPEEEVLDE